MSKQGDKQWLRKQLAVKAMIKVVESETANVKGTYEQLGTWKELWQKKEDVMELVMDDGSLVALRI
jgi:hypothetical protein